jgi:outer membrane receptor protein involved in Fe transport
MNFTVSEENLNSLVRNGWDFNIPSNYETQYMTGHSGYDNRMQGSIASFFARANWNYDEKYMATAIIRADGSSKFAPGNQWGWFPSISGAWVISDEPFMKNVKWIDQLKLRLAFGLAGNNNIDSDLWRYRYTVSTEGGPGFGEQRQYGEMYYSSPSQYPNKDIKWETTITRNLAADITLFGGRLTITPEVYWNTTRDLLYKSAISTTSGYNYQTQNIGKVENKGFELTVNGDILRGKDFVLSGNLTLGRNKMTVKELTHLTMYSTTTLTVSTLPVRMTTS